jgi:hypothetical protein
MLANGHKDLRPEWVGEVVKTALTAARPKTRYVVTLKSTLSGQCGSRRRTIPGTQGWSQLLPVSAKNIASTGSRRFLNAAPSPRREGKHR